MEMSFDAEKWVLVGDKTVDPHTSTQIEIIKDKDIKIKGAILCDDEKQKDSEACKLPAFPTFCNVDTQICVAGLRETEEQFEALQKISNDKSKQ